jgi:hypothetical protein
MNHSPRTSPDLLFQLASDADLNDRSDEMGVSTIMETKTSGAVETERKCVTVCVKNLRGVTA